MSRVKVIVLTLAFILGTGAAAPSSTLRVAAVTGATAACAELGPSSPAGERAYYAHLAKRLGVKVIRCPVIDAAAAARALAAGKLDMAVLDPAAFATVATTTRAILTVRPNGGLNRIPVVLGVRSASAATSLASLRGKSIVFAGRTPAALDLPRLVLGQRGLPQRYWGRDVITADADAAVATLRAGGADAMILHAAAWQRLCRAQSPKVAPPCADLRTLSRMRAQAAHAIVVRRDIDGETRYRLIGIHMPLHLENAAAFAWAASWAPDAAEFQPAEPLALVATR